MKAVCYDNDKIVKTFYNIIKVEKEKKYNYYIFHQKIYHHTIIWTVRFTEVNKVVLFDKDNKIVKEIAV